ncbi:protein tyrosine phosphatase receptor type C-associated protein [Sorex araneus]|uniref:protein tyrosine phosphatase receptor type C-associated protein n=1 Tax=Sorex araneus TaxID=42254 RepID=UPI00243358C5|nr:protein tyrosine phosphatase receptor type C-associated protein [Sorex araneus]
MGPAVGGLGLLLALPGALGSDSSAQERADQAPVIAVLLVLLLLLLAGLALAWRRLSRDSGGYYHPARLGAALWGRACRLLQASPPGRWLQARLDPERQEEEPAGGECGWEPAADLEEQRDAEEPSPQRVLMPAEDSDQEHDADADMQGPAGAGGSSEALLSGLQAFAGSAAWDDGAGAAGAQGLHVTAL